MTGSALPLDGAVVGFLLRVLDRFERTVSSPSVLLASLKGVGLDDAALTQYQSFLSARAADLAKLSTDLPKLLDALESNNPDLLSLIGPANDLWSVVSGLVADAPKLDVASLPHAPALPNGDVMGQLVTQAVDGALREASTALWTALSSTGFVGPGASILSALSAAIDDPVSYVWQQFQALRRQNTLTIAGVLTGPRVVSTASVRLGAKESPSAAASAAFGASAKVLQRLVLKVAADTYGKPVTLSVDILSTETLPPSFVAAVLSVEAIAAPIALGPALQLSIDPPDEVFAIALTGYGAVKALGGSTPKLTLAATTQQSYQFGAGGGIRLSLQQPVFQVEASLDAWDASFGVDGFEITIPKSAAGDLLGIFLPSSGIVMRGKLLFKVDTAGLHFDGGVGLSAKWPDTVRLPGVLVHSLSTTVGVSGSEFLLTAAGTVVVSLGPVTATIEGFGITQPLRLTTDGSGNLGILDLQRPGFATPSGIGIAIDAGVVKGGGFLRLTDTQIAGAARARDLARLDRTVGAGLRRDRADQRPALVHRRDVGQLRAADRDRPRPDAERDRRRVRLQPQRRHDRARRRGARRPHRRRADPARPDQARRPRARSGLQRVPGQGRAVRRRADGRTRLGPAASLVTMTAAVVFTFPNPSQIVIIGELRIQVPKPDAPVVNLQADFAGTIDRSTGDVSFDASLAHSKIGNFDVTGDIALRAGSQGFVFTAGGFNPSFTPPAGLTSMRRLAISISPSPVLKVAADAYFALTASTLQFGAAMYVEAKLGPIGAKGHVSLDTLIHTEPKVHFSATISGEFQLAVSGEEIASMNVDVLLEGPGHWHARAEASISLFFLSISGTLDLEWGTDTPVELGPPVDVAQLVHDALAADATWAHVLPAADAGSAQLRSGAAALHPLGQLRLTQTAAPLDVGLAKLGASAVTSGDPVTVAISAAGAVVTVAQELFATTQFFDLSDEERLAKPAFLPFDAGGLLQGEDWQVSDAQSAAVVYEESIGDDGAVNGPRQFRPLDAVALGWTRLGAAGRAAGAPARTAGVIGVKTTSYAVADAATGAIVSSGTASAVSASTRRSADTIAVADFELEGVA